MDREVAEILSRAGKPRPFLPATHNIEPLRKRWSAGTQRFMENPKVVAALSPSSCEQKPVRILVRDGTSIEGRLYSPLRASVSPTPLFVMFHGGGYCLGGLDTEAFTCRLICQRLQMAVLDVAYRLSPEHPFPTGVHDAFDAVKWAAASFQSWNVDLKKGFFVGGISGGATFAAVVSHLWRQEKQFPDLTGAFLSTPIFPNNALVDNMDVKLFADEYLSQEQNADAPVLDMATSKCFWDLYEPDRSSALYCPFLFETFDNHPPTYLSVCELDPFRDGGRIYNKLLRSAGVETRTDHYPGLPHAFWAVFPTVSATQKWMQDTVAGAAWLLCQGRLAQISCSL